MSQHASTSPYQAERDELRQLYSRVSNAAFPDAGKAVRVLEAFFDALDGDLSAPLRKCLRALLAQERLGKVPDIDTLDLKQQLELKKRLCAWELKALDGQELLERLGAVPALAPRAGVVDQGYAHVNCSRSASCASSSRTTTASIARA